jgi:hypothetical protein
MAVHTAQEDGELQANLGYIFCLRKPTKMNKEFPYS